MFLTCGLLWEHVWSKFGLGFNLEQKKFIINSVSAKVHYLFIVVLIIRSGTII